MRVLIIRLENELGTAQWAAGVTDRDFQRVEAECATPVGVDYVEQRFAAANEKMWNDVSTTTKQQSVDANGRSVGGDVVVDAAAGEHVADAGSRRETATCGYGGGHWWL